jgi:integration host factor subunit alpha
MQVNNKPSNKQALTKSEICATLQEANNLDKNAAKEIVDCIFQAFVYGIIQEGELKISGFGSFYVHDKSSRLGRNPKTGEPAHITQRRVSCFYPSQKLKAFLQDSEK